jgi:hypothetical protein
VRSGGEFGRGDDASELVSDAYLRRWLVARDWNVEVTHKLLLRHADWRARTSPKGYIEEVRPAVAPPSLFRPSRWDAAAAGG